MQFKPITDLKQHPVKVRLISYLLVWSIQSMYTGKLIFAQVMGYLPQHTLRRCIQRYKGNQNIKSFSCQDQFRCMAFAQLTYRERLRDIEACLKAQSNKLYHMGIRSKVARNTLADANEKRDWRIYAV